jgi:hypothetical protein
MATLLKDKFIAWQCECDDRFNIIKANEEESMNDAKGADLVQLTKRQDKLDKQLREFTRFEERVHHLADMRIEIDIDDGVKKNYKILADVLAQI